MDSTVTLVTNPRKREYSATKSIGTASNPSNTSDISYSIAREKNSTGELESIPESLSLLRCLCSIDSTDAFKNENQPISDSHLTRILNLETKLVREKNDEDVPNIVNNKEYIELSPTCVVSTEEREDSNSLSIHKDRQQENLPPSVSSSPSPRSVISTKSQEQIISAGHVQRDSIQIKQTKKPFSNHDLCDSALVFDERRKSFDTEEDIDDLARELDIWGPPDEDEEKTISYTASREQQNSGSTSPVLSPGLVSEARLAGIHAAVALFRRPSVASKKYTRAPISKIFISLDITAEMFLKLQGAAKVYMLDERFPERRKAIGAKSRSEKDLNKLKLYSLVKQFLEEDGWGERCFGCKAEGADQRKFKWPDSKNKIINLVTPLMRRMVTNEKQRRYANETRLEKRLENSKKRGAEIKSTVNLSRSVEPEIILGSSESPNIQSRDDDSHLQAIPDSNLDTNLNAIIEYIASSSTNKSLNESQRSDIPRNEQIPTLEKAVMKYYINFLRDGCRIKERLDIVTDQCLYFSKLIHHVNQSIDHRQEQIFNIKVHGPDGIIKVFDEDSWAQAVLLIFKHQWMDQEVRCLINLEKAS